MTHTLIEMSEDEFHDQYQLMKNHLNPHASWVYGDSPGCLFETYGEELEFVRQQNPSTVWTLVDGDDGDQYLVSGYHFVNRIGYLVSTLPVPDEVDIEVHIPMQTDPGDEPAEQEAALDQPDRRLSQIGNEHLGIPTLDTQGSDALDFHDVAVWQVEAALKAAFDVGRSATTHPKPQRAPRQPSAPLSLPTPLFVPKGTPLTPGKMYLRLYHGRTDPSQEMDDWGFDGPTFGPLSCYVHTYCCTFRIHGDSDTNEVWLEKHDDMIQWEGCFYGDMELFIASDNNRA
jgi:hypothetical protein